MARRARAKPAPVADKLAGLYLDPSDLDGLTPTERAELATLLEYQVGGEGLVDFVNRVWPDEPVPRHLLPLAAAIERARVMPIRIAVSMPPGAAKTTFLTRAVAWWVSRSPADLCAYTTFSQQRARENSALARAYAVLGGVVVVKTAAGYWTTANSGGLIATGPSGLTGKRIPGLLIYDDPYKNADEAASERRGRAVIANFKQVAKTRLQGGSCIVVHTRWDDNDLVAYCVSELGFEHINIAAIAEAANDNEAAGELVPPDVLGREPGESYWPERYPVKQCVGMCGHDGHLEEMRDTTDAWTWAAMYQGRTRPLLGGMFKRGFFKIVDEAPASAVRARAWDFASSTKPGAAWSVGIRGCVVDGKVYIEHVFRERVDGGDILDQVVGLAKADGAEVEVDIPRDPGQAAEMQVKHIARSLPMHVVHWSPELKGKATRARPLASFSKAGGIVLVDGPWVDTLLRELCGFPSGKFKDQVDAMVRLVARLLVMAESSDGPGGGSFSIARGSRAA